MVEEDPGRHGPRSASRETSEKRIEVPGEKVVVGDIHDDPCEARRGATRTAAPFPDGVPIGVGVDAAMHAYSGHQRRWGETIEPAFDKIPRQVAGEQQRGLGGEQGMGEMVHRDPPLCFGPTLRIVQGARRDGGMNFETARYNMVEQQVRTWEVLDQAVLDRLFAVPRERFVPDDYRPSRLRRHENTARRRGRHDAPPRGSPSAAGARPRRPRPRAGGRHRKRLPRGAGRRSLARRVTTVEIAPERRVRAERKPRGITTTSR